MEIALWGGIECTLNRVGDQYLDQLEMSGHYRRADDIDCIAGLGIKTLRYPILWEKHMPRSDSPIDWSFSAPNLERMRDLGIRPIAGLVHHGSGPSYCTLDDDNFPEALAAYAGLVARRFPWIDLYTPVNEPLTTARFCGLYGIWFPHQRNDHIFLRILINSCKGIILAMKAIREVNPAAKLVQTEDLGKTYSTPLLQYQADFENHRRWLSYDLLCGKVDINHPLWNYFTDNGISGRDLSFFQRHSCPPDILGLDHYHSSERFLDERLEYYPSALHGGNSQHHYADVAAVRVQFENPGDPYTLIHEVWDRYHLPLAITEVHLNTECTDQLRWLYTMWKTAHALRCNGVDIIAVTSWALLGSYGWNALVTSANGQYEAGAFDLSNNTRKPTLLARMIAALANQQPFHHAVLMDTGWWEKENRWWYFQPSLCSQE